MYFSGYQEHISNCPCVWIVKPSTCLNNFLLSDWQTDRTDCLITTCACTHTHTDNTQQDMCCFRTSCLMLGFRCYEVERKESEKTGQLPGIEPRTPWLELPVLLPLSYDNQTTTSPYNPLYILHILTFVSKHLNLSISQCEARWSKYLEWENHSVHLMERIFQSTPNGVLMVLTEWLPGVGPKHSVSHILFIVAICVMCIP